MGNEARFIRADRAQARWDIIDLEGFLPSDHRARIVVSFVEGLDVSELYAAIKAREGEPGRPPADPAVLLALWLYATIEGVGSARELERLCERDLAYRWIAGGVPLNYHGLADFRVGHVELLDRLLKDSVTALIAEGIVSLAEVAVDGTKVRAQASPDSFKTADKLDRIAAAVERRLAGLKAEIEKDPAACSRRQQAARERAAQDVTARSQRAHQTLEKLRAERAERAKTHKKDEEKKGEPKASLSDPEARFMRFSDGAYRPGYNAQIAVAPKEGIILAVTMTDRRNDAGLAAPMVEAIVERYGQAPRRLLVDTNYAAAEDIAALAAHPAGPVTVFAPPPAESEKIKPATLARRAKKRAQEPESVREWRNRMASPEGQEVFSLRKFIERINGNLKNHGFGFMPVRGLIKTKAVALWHAIAHNLMTSRRLRLKAAHA